MVNKLEINVPESLSDISLSQYKEWVKLVEAVGEDKESKSDFLDRALIEIFCKVSIQDIASIKATEFSKILDILQETFSKESKELVTRFSIDGVEYGFEPNVQDMLTGVYIDTEAHIVSWETLETAMAALYRPITHVRKARGFEQYEIEKYNPSEEKSNTMLDMPLEAAMSAKVFFYSLGKELSMITLAYLETEQKKEQDTQQRKTLEQSGDGINQFIRSQEEMHSNSMKQHPYHYFKL